MKMILNNGKIIGNGIDAPEKTMKYIRKFWDLPTKKELEKEKDKYYTVDCKREWQKMNKVDENNEITI